MYGTWNKRSPLGTLTSNLLSRTPHGKISEKKSETIASRPIDWKPVHLKSPIGFKYPYLLIRPIRGMGFYHAKQQQSNIWELLFWLGQIGCQMSPNPKTNQIPTTVPPHISINNGRMGTFQVAILCACTVIRHMCHMNKIFVHLWGGDVWWSIRNHGRIVFVAIYRTFM